MANYIIEGTVTEITLKSKNELSFKIAGTEGFALQRKPKDSNEKKKYNVLLECDENGDIKESPQAALVCNNNEEFKVSKQSTFLSLETLTAAATNGKRIRLILEEKDSKNAGEGSNKTPISISEKEFKLSSLSLLSD